MSRRSASRHAPSKARSPRAVIASGFVVAILSVPGTVAATNSFPKVITTEWAVDKLPVSGDGCMLCHANDDGLEVTQPFGITVKKRGAIKDDNESLRNALETIREYDYYFDSDRDGVNDYQEVAIDGTNPNDRNSFVPPVGGGGEGGGGGDPGYKPPPPLPFGLLPPPLEHGCSSASARPGVAQGFFAFFALALIAGARFRRAQRRLR